MATTKITDITLAKKSGTTLTLHTEGKYVASDVSFGLDAQDASPSFDGGDLSGNSTATGTNVTLISSNNGMKIQTKYSASSADVLYNGAVDGWVSKGDNAVALEGKSLASSNGEAYYVTAVTMPKDKGFTVTTTADTALDTTSDLDVTNNAYRRVDIDNKANGRVIIANSGTTAVTSGSSTAGNVTVTAYNASGNIEDSKQIVGNGKWSTPTVSSSGTYYGRVTVSDGNYSASVASHSITTTPVVTGSVSGTVTSIATTSKPSGTDGTTYWTITPSGSVTTTGVSSAKGRANITTAGYVSTGSTEQGGTSTVSITPTVTNGTARYIVRGTIINNTSGGTSSGTINRGSQIKINSGYYPSTLYYTAQSNNGTKNITSSGTISCNGYDKVSVPDASPSFTGGTVSGTASASASGASISSSTNSSGITITANGSATRAKVTYNSAVNGWVSKSSGADAYAAGSATSLTSTTYYLNGVTLTAPSSGTRTFTVTLPNGDNDTITLTFTVDSDGNWSIE